MITPLLHDFTYESMVMDMVEPEFIESESSPKIKAKPQNLLFILREDDPLWTKYRDMHISDAMRTLTLDFRQFKADNLVFEEMRFRSERTPPILEQSDKRKSLRWRESNLQQLIDAVNRLPEFKKMTRFYSLHIELMRHVMKKFNVQNIKYVAGIEQDIVAFDQYSKRTYKAVIQEAESLIANKHENKLAALNQLRLLLILIFSVPSKDLGSLPSQLHGIDPDLIKKIKKTSSELGNSLRQKLISSCRERNRLDVKPTARSRFVSVMENLGVGARLNRRHLREKSNDSTNSPFNSVATPFELSRHNTTLSYILRGATSDLLDPSYFSIAKQRKDKNGFGIRISTTILNPLKESIINIKQRRSTALWSRAPTWQKKTPLNGFSKNPVWETYSIDKSGNDSQKTNSTGESSATELSLMFDVHKKRFNGTNNTPKLVVFIVGGITYPEIRDVNLLSSELKTDIYLGSTHIITPESFINDLSSNKCYFFEY
ncbi:Protein transport protein sec1 [Smittium mucronatum]|uniref:Protein transport protein sec1 n=1 Tax=Smittium mucronatum TaxID=133383 RepID=A0A1R0H532_9FUNG|nr:Protein transport protein sec1 [Smittium mucronatum]